MEPHPQALQGREHGEAHELVIGDLGSPGTEIPSGSCALRSSSASRQRFRWVGPPFGSVCRISLVEALFKLAARIAPGRHFYLFRAHAQRAHADRFLWRRPLGPARGSRSSPFGTGRYDSFFRAFGPIEGHVIRGPIRNEGPSLGPSCSWLTFGSPQGGFLSFQGVEGGSAGGGAGGTSSSGVGIRPRAVSSLWARAPFSGSWAASSHSNTS